MSNFSDNLKKLRKSRGMTQSELADKVFTSVQSVSRWETGESEPSIDMLVGISSVFSISVNQLIGIGKLPEDELFDGIAEYIRCSDTSDLSNSTIMLCRQIVRGFFNRSFEDEWKLNPKSRERKTYSTIHKNGFGGIYADRSDTPVMFTVINVKNFDFSTIDDCKLPEIFASYADKETYSAMLKIHDIPSHTGYDRESLCFIAGIREENFEFIVDNLKKAGYLDIKSVNVNDLQTVLYFPHMSYEKIMLLAFVKLIYLNSTDGNI